MLYERVVESRPLSPSEAFLRTFGVCFCAPPPLKFSPPRGKIATQKDGSDVQLHQMTSSAVGNIPEKDVDGIKASLLRGVMHADETFFSFKVRLWVAYSRRTHYICSHAPIFCDYFILCIPEKFT